MTTSLILAITLLLQQSTLALLPLLQSPRQPFGVAIPAAASNNDTIAAMKRSFVRNNAIFAVVAAALLFIPGAATSVAPYVLLTCFGLVFATASILKFAKAIKAMVAEHGWATTTGTIGGVTAGTMSNVATPVARISWVPYLFTLVCIIGTTAYLLGNWAQIPDVYATHWNARNEADGFTNKGPAVFSGQYTALGLLLAGVLTSWLMSHATIAYRNNNDARSRAAQTSGLRAIEQSQAWIMGVTACFVAILGTVIALPDTFPTNTVLRVVLIGVPIILLISLGTIIVVHYKMTTAAAQVEPNPNDPRERVVPDNSKFYKFGTFYYNPDDPAVLVDKRIGIGMDFNYAHWQGKVFLVVIGIILVGCLSLAFLL